MIFEPHININGLDDLDQFDRIPDSLVLDIFNKVADVRCLGRCSAVSRRFNALVPLVQNVFVKMDDDDLDGGDTTAANDEDPLNLSSSSSSRKPRNLFSHLMKLVFFTLIKPLFHTMRTSGENGTGDQKKPFLPQVFLKNFTHVENLMIELPAGDVGTEDGLLLKWRAEFGSTLQNCVILGGTKLEPVNNNNNNNVVVVVPPVVEQNGSIPDSFYTNGGLKLRVVWTISSLIAASTRHYLIRPIIEEHPTIKTLVLTDADGQGTLSMSEDQIKEFRESPMMPASASSNRTQVPASQMKLQYAPVLELPDGVALQGATLVAIKPSSQESEESDNMGWNHSAAKISKEAEKFVSRAFDGPLEAAAVRALVKRRNYLLEMNGF